MNKIALLLLVISTLPCAAKEVYFTPGDQPANIIVSKINNAKSEIRVQAYGFTMSPIMKALCRAKARGVNVQIIADRSNLTARSSGIHETHACGIPISIDSRHKIAHNKVIVIDQRVVIGGSYNYSASAENGNAENMTVDDDGVLAHRYLDNWMTHLGHSETFEGP